jgi:hypothetical protein
VKQSESPAGNSPVKRWRAHCLRQPQTFAAFVGSPTQQQRAARFESHAISRLLCDFETLEVRAVALRSIAELRECSIRQVADFFAIEDAVTIAALSLLPDAMVVVAQPETRHGLVRAA